MNLVKKILLTGAVAIGGCCFNREYLEPDFQLETPERKVSLYDRNRDGRWDKITCTQKEKQITYGVEDSDFNGSYEKLGSFSKYDVLIYDDSGQARLVKNGKKYVEFIDRDDNGKYDFFRLEMSSIWGTDVDIVFKDNDGDEIFEECIDNLTETKYEFKVSFKETIKEYLKVFNGLLEDGKK